MGKEDVSGDGNDKSAERDLSRVRFPSDRISIGGLRQRFPELFDKGDETRQPIFFLEDGHNRAEDILGEMLNCERLIASFAYNKACGNDSNVTGIRTSAFKRELAEQYISLGIASGPKHAVQLIRDFERQAAELANRRTP
ncbi:MAG TPA: hypothetical protein VGN12_07720 [Pirellulales bacterium]|jgi:hypothetical protein